MSGKRHRDFVPLSRSAIAYLREVMRDHRGAALTLIDLLAEANTETGEVVASIRWLSMRLKVSRNTLTTHLGLLARVGLVEISTGQHGHDATILRIPRYDWFTAVVDGGSEPDPVSTKARENSATGGSTGGSEIEPDTAQGGSVGGSIAGSEVEPLDTHLPAATPPRTSRTSRREELQDTHAPTSSPLRGSSALGTTPYEDDRALDPWIGLAGALTAEGFDENDVALALARRWTHVHDPKVPFEEERRRVPTLAEVREELARA